MNKTVIASPTPSTLALAGGLLGGRADFVLRTGTLYTMRVYEEILHNRLDFRFLATLETEINARCRALGYPEIYLAELFQSANGHAALEIR